MNGEPILILADPNGKAYNFAKTIYEKLNSNEKRDRVYQFGDVNIKKFNNGEIFSEIKANVRKKTCFYIHDSTMDPQDWAMSLAITNDALMRSSAGKINNILPSINYSRQDRMASPRTPITASVLANMIQQNAYRVITTDIHNPAIQGSYQIPFDNLKAYPVIINHLKKNHPEFLENAVLVAPDIGSAKKVEGYVRRLGLDVAIADKKRTKAGEVDSMTMIGNVEGKNVIIVDDMIDTGGTLLKAVETVKEKGARKIFVCATHGIFSNNAREKFENSQIEKVIVTDSIPQESRGKIEVISLTNLFADAIFRISHGQSISEMFE